jgi:hypothetical protein
MAILSVTHFPEQDLAKFIREPDFKEVMESVGDSVQRQHMPSAEILKQASQQLQDKPTILQIRKVVKQELEKGVQGQLQALYIKIGKEAETIITKEGANWSQRQYIALTTCIGAGIGAVGLGGIGAAAGVFVGVVAVPGVGAIPGAPAGAVIGGIAGAIFGAVVGAQIGANLYWKKQLKAVTEAMNNHELKSFFIMINVHQLLPTIFELSSHSVAAKERLKTCYTPEGKLFWAPMKRVRARVGTFEFEQVISQHKLVEYEPDFDMATKIHYFFINWIGEKIEKIEDEDEDESNKNLIEVLKNCKITVFDSLSRVFLMFERFIRIRQFGEPTIPNDSFVLEKTMQQAALNYRKNPTENNDKILTDAYQACAGTSIEARMTKLFQESKKTIDEVNSDDTSY